MIWNSGLVASQGHWNFLKSNKNVTTGLWSSQAVWKKTCDDASSWIKL